MQDSLNEIDVVITDRPQLCPRRRLTCISVTDSVSLLLVRASSIGFTLRILSETGTAKGPVNSCRKSEGNLPAHVGQIFVPLCPSFFPNIIHGPSDGAV